VPSCRSWWLWASSRWSASSVSTGFMSRWWRWRSCRVVRKVVDPPALVRALCAIPALLSPCWRRVLDNTLGRSRGRAPPQRGLGLSLWTVRRGRRSSRARAQADPPSPASTIPRRRAEFAVPLPTASFVQLPAGTRALGAVFLSWNLPGSGRST
jgi:hypothetical protein